MDKTPLSVQLKVPVEIVIDLFTKMGPRYIIVKENGKLCGIITKKDILNYIQNKA
jgi:chloride channel 3/4/5